MDVRQQGSSLNRVPSDNVALSIGRMHLEILALNFELENQAMMLAALQPTPAPQTPPAPPEPSAPDVTLDSQEPVN